MSRPFAPRLAQFDSTVRNPERLLEVAKLAALESIAQSLEFFRREYEEHKAEEAKS